MYPRNFDSKQGGFLLPAAIFLVVALTALAIGVSRLSSQSNASVFREGISVQAFYAAETGLQWGMNQVLFPSADQAAATTNCAAVANADPDIAELVLNVSGLRSCNVNVSCSSSTSASGSTTFYTLVSAANCGGGQVYAERTLQASAYISE